MALTLVEASKLAAERGEAFRSGVIEQYARSSELLRVLTFQNIQGNALRYNREDTLPGVGFRGINEAYSESTGIVNPQVEPLVIAGGDLDVDEFITTTMGENQRTTQELMKIKSLAHYFAWACIKGDSTSDPRVLDGLQVRVTGNQLISAGSTAGGAALSLAKLDEAIDLVSMPTHIICNKAIRRRLSAAARSTTVGGFINYRPDEFGRQVAYYQDLPLIVLDEDNAGNKILPFSEAAASGSATACSIYVVSIGDGMLTGIQAGDMRVKDMGELQTKESKRTRISWYAGLAAMHGKCAARLYQVGDLAVVV